MGVSIKDLNTQVLILNNVKNQPTQPYTDNGDRTCSANIGNYHVDQAYGGCKLVQIVSETGGIREVSKGGFIPKRQLLNQIRLLVDNA